MPAALTVIWCRPNRFGGLAFAWQGPPGRTPVDGYRVERTRDGRDYEPVAEIRRQDFVLAPPAFSPNSEVELARRAGSAAFRPQERRKARRVPVALFLAGLLRRERRAPCAHAAGRGLAASEFGVIPATAIFGVKRARWPVGRGMNPFRCRMAGTPKHCGRRLTLSLSRRKEAEGLRLLSTIRPKLMASWDGISQLMGNNRGWTPMSTDRSALGAVSPGRIGLGRRGPFLSMSIRG